jgi:DNA (cytosine-5)-methyltransferase 1
MAKSYNYIDLFSGCGGLSLGLHNAGWKGMFAIEKSKDAFETIKHNLIENKNHFDWPSWLDKAPHEIDEIINKYENRLIELQGQVDLVAGGPPCQGFSTAGRRKEDDVRNGLIKSYLRFVDLVKPKIIFFENVRGFTLKFHKNKSQGLVYANFVVDELNKQGYDVFGKLVDFSRYGIPQKRTRFILVGVKKEIAIAKKISAKLFFKQLTRGKKDFFENKNLPQSPNIGSAISDLLKVNGTKPTPDRKGFDSGIYSSPKSKYQRFLREGYQLAIPNSHSFAKHRKDITKRFAYLIKVGNGKNINDDLRKKLNLSKHTIIPLSINSKSPTITTLPDDYIHFCEPRILTVREYARIQSFPDWYEFKGKYTTGGKERTREVPRYTQIGNAIPPLFGEQSGLVLKQLIC